MSRVIVQRSESPLALSRSEAGLFSPPVLIVGNFLSHANASRGVCEDLVEHLQQRHWRVTYTSRQPGRMARLLDMVSTTWRARRQYRVAQVDVYSGPSFIWAEIVCRLLRRLGKPYILTLHGGNLPQFARQHPRRVQQLLGSAQVVTAPSPYLLEEMKPYRSDLLLLANPIDLPRYPFRLRAHPAPKLVWLRSFHHLYNPTMAVEVLHQLLPAIPDATLLMVGPDRQDGSFQATQALAATRQVAHRVQFAGAVAKSEVPAYLAQGDIFLNTTNVDNTPVSVIEAMACGLCVASTNVGGIPYLLKHGEDTLLTPPGDAAAMAAGIQRILTEPGLAERLSANARAKVELFDWRAVLPQWEALFRSIASKG